MDSSNSLEKENNNEFVSNLSDDVVDEIDINIHFHCEHCIKLKKCHERPKQGWSCEIIICPHGCGHRFHACKTSEHELLCSHVRMPCLNAGNGCPFIITRRFIAQHLPVCPASVIICNAEWNRWAVGAKEREKISSTQGFSSLYNQNDLDLCFAINDQKMVNDMHSFPKYVRKLMCNDINKRFPSLPLTIRGSYHEDIKIKSLKERGQSISTTDDEEDGLTPGLSLSVCTELIKGKLLESSSSLLSNNEDLSKFNNKQVHSDDISDRCCSHGIMKSICQFCKNDADEPVYKFATVWREIIEPTSPASIVWIKETRIDKVRKRGPLGHFCYKRVDDFDEDDEEDMQDESNSTIECNSEKSLPCHINRFQTPPPAPLTPIGLILEVGLKHFSRHQVKPKAMFTFQCMQEVRRDEFESHYQNVHSEIQEGLDGWLMQRCPLHIIGCPFSTMRMFPGNKQEEAKVIYCPFQRGFGIAPTSDNKIDKEGLDQSQSPSTEKSIIQKKMHSIPEENTVQFMASSLHITTLPFEILQSIVSCLDGFSLNNVSCTCRLLREVCYSQLEKNGLVIQEWNRCLDGDRMRWKIGNNRWFFSNCFHHVRHWSFKNEGLISNHLTVCPFNDRTLSNKKFSYIPNINDEIQNLSKKFSKL